MNMLTVLPRLNQQERYVMSNLLWTYHAGEVNYDDNPGADHAKKICRDLANLALADRATVIDCIKKHIKGCHQANHPNIAPKFEALLAKVEEDFNEYAHPDAQAD